jgi:ABC-type multidrug transport system fused ATPase/permease subunit
MTLPLTEYWRLLVSYLRTQRLAVACLSVLLAGAIALQLASPLIVRSFIDAAQRGSPSRELVGTALLFLGVALVQQVAGVLSTWLSENVGWRATNGLRRDLLQHCLDLEAPFHNARTPGELIERVDGDVTALANFFSQFVIRIVGSALLLAGVLVLLAREDWRVGAVMAVFAFGALAVLNALRRLAAPRWEAAFDTRADFGGFLEERLAAAEDVRSSGAVPSVLRQLHVYMRLLMLRYRAAMISGHHSWVAANVVNAAGLAAGLALGAYLYHRGEATIGTVYLIASYGALLGWPLEELTAQMQDFQQATAAIFRVRDLRRVEPTIRDGPGADFPAGPLSLEFRGVEFAYGDGPPVLHGVSFAVDAGETLGVLGRTGSGKTTLTRLLFRLYDAHAGSILLGGTDIRRARLAELRERVGLVTQEVQLFHGTVAQNLTLFDPTVPEARLLEAIRELGLMPWFESLPEGLHTHLAGSRGLSAGEAQLLALTRVFLKDPGLVVLDEPTSRVDPATERLLERAIDRLLAGRTAIVVAHRLRTVASVDSILIVEAGRCREHGPRAELAADPSSELSRLFRTGLEEALA